MATLLALLAPVQSDPEILAIAAAWEPGPPLDPALPLAEWIEGQASLYRSPIKLDAAAARDGELLLELIADALQDLALGVKFHRVRTPAEYLDHTCRFGAMDSLSQVSIPLNRGSYLAGELDSEAEAFAELGTDAGLLCAATILLLADDAEELHAHSAEHYLRLCEARDIKRRDDLAVMMCWD